MGIEPRELPDSARPINHLPSAIISRVIECDRARTVTPAKSCPNSNGMDLPRYGIDARLEM